VRQESKQKHFARVEVHRADEAILIAANVEHDNRIAAGYTHLIRGTIELPHVREMPELFPANNPPPGFQTRCGLRVLGAENRQRRFLNNPHAYILCSFAGFVKSENGNGKFLKLSRSFFDKSCQRVFQIG
jgi:hypothetical protein